MFRKACLDEAQLLVVYPEWPHAPWYPAARQLELRSVLIDFPCYLDAKMYPRPKPKWDTRAAVIDGSLANSATRTALGISARRVRFNRHPAVRTYEVTPDSEAEHTAGEEDSPDEQPVSSPALSRDLHSSAFMADAACGEPTEGTPAADGQPSADAGGEPTKGTPAAVVLATTDPPTDALSAHNVVSRFLRVVAGLRPVFRA